MVCSSCGEKLKNTSKDFTKAVIEINNPESLVLLRKVVIPASMGTEEEIPAAIGKYRNVLLQYEANNHVYIYSSDGIPTAITAEVPQEIINQIADLEEAVDDLKDSSDVVDVVSTYAALQSYDTSSLTANDIVHVLADETHENHSTYYRWDSATSAWAFIGADAGGAGASSWGSITGNIANQTDLQQEFGNYTPTANLAAVATSGSYNDLSNKPSLSTVATTGSYNDLSNKPTIPSAQVNSDWNAASGVAQILNKPSLATVATSGSYNDLSNKPSIPAAQVNSDWNASTGVAQILNKPSLATVATTGAYSDLSGTPTIPTVNDATLTIQQNGVNVATFTANSSSNATANITSPIITMTSTDPGEGAPLAANNFIGVYE